MTKILIAGDFYPHSRVDKLIYEKKYDEIFDEVRPLIQAADYSIVNLESPVVIGAGKPIRKIGPNLRCTPDAVEAIKYSGFDMVTLANNHFYDYGDEGVHSTVKVCTEFGLDTVGGGASLQEAERISYKEIEGKRFSFINFCEHEFSIATKISGGSNPLNPVANFYQIQEARRNTDFVIVIVHGGHEHFQLPSIRMKESYRFFIDSGADAVVNYHQHCYSGYEVYKDKPIFYGLGNFCFDWDGKRNSNWNLGYTVSLIFNRPTIDFELNPYIQGDEFPGIRLIKDINEFNEKLNNLNRIICDEDQLTAAFMEFVETKRQDIYVAFEPYSDIRLKALRKRKIIPSFLNQQRLLKIINLIDCESHKDIVSSALEILKNEKNTP